MAKRAASSTPTSTTKKKTSAPVAATPTDEVAAVSPVRKTVAPRKTAAKAAVEAAGTVAGPTITHEMIAQRAYYIAISGTGGTETDNWYRAEAELKREQGA